MDERIEYEVTVAGRNDNWRTVVKAKSAGAAKAAYFAELAYNAFDDIKFTDLRARKCRKKREAADSDKEGR